MQAAFAYEQASKVRESVSLMIELRHTMKVAQKKGAIVALDRGFRIALMPYDSSFDPT